MPKKRKPKGKKAKRQPRATSGLADHHQQGKKLLPPFSRLPGNVKFASWRDQRLPEMLWAVLLISLLNREHALAIFRNVATGGEALQGVEGIFDITHTGLASLPGDHPSRMIGLICEDVAAREALAPLLLFRDLPAAAIWREALAGTPAPSDWRPLMIAVAKTLFHQSQEATDCRWLRVLFPMATGRMHFNVGLEEMARGILGYPNYGDPGRVRAEIRATEGGMDSVLPDIPEWPAQFWELCRLETPCFEPPEEQEQGVPSVGTSRTRVRAVREALVEHFLATLTTTAVDPRHDTSFGIGLFALGVLDDLLAVGASASISGRFGLRSLLECYVTLAYLAKRDDSSLWKSYRVYGSGQAKLALLKMEDDSARPEYVTYETLEALANEDVWQEYVEIDLGHWDRTNLRKMAEHADVKDTYDRYYPWTSSYLHGHWASIRDSVFQTCLNPLHRTHRVPRQTTRMLDDVLKDACTLTDAVLEVLHVLYSQFPHRVTMDLGRGAI